MSMNVDTLTTKENVFQDVYFALHMKNDSSRVYDSTYICDFSIKLTKNHFLNTMLI